MRVLVTAASKHGATMHIAEVIADVLTDHGVAANAERVEDVTTLAPYDAVVLGSAIYYGRWKKSAVAFADLHLQELSDRPVWLFSSGPVADMSTSKPAAEDKSPIKGVLKPRDQRVFGGALDKAQLGIAERALVRGVRAKYGDFRDWDEIRAWAMGIADALNHEASTAVATQD